MHTEHNNLLREDEEISEEDRTNVVCGTAYSKSFILQCLIDMSRGGNMCAEDEGVRLLDRMQILEEMMGTSTEVCQFIVSIDDVLVTISDMLESEEISPFAGGMLEAIVLCNECNSWVVGNAEAIFAVCVQLFESLQIREVCCALTMLRWVFAKPNLEFGMDWITWFTDEDTRGRLNFALRNAPSELGHLAESILQVLKVLLQVSEDVRREYAGFLLNFTPEDFRNEETVSLYLQCICLLDTGTQISSNIRKFLADTQKTRESHGKALLEVVDQLIKKLE